MIEKLKEKIDSKQLLKIFIMVLIVVIMPLLVQKVAYADTLLEAGSKNPFNNIKDGWGQFISDIYRNNYQLDADVGTFSIDNIINQLSNLIFYLMLIISWLGINIFNFCFNNNISSKFSEIINGVSSSLKEGVFDKFFMLMFVISLISILIYFLKRNYAAVINQIVIATLLSIMAIMFTSSAASNFVTSTLNISNDIGMTLVSSISKEENSEMAINNMIGTLWGNLVHKPWMILEYDGKISVTDSNKDQAISKAKEMLSLDKNSSERKELVKQEIKDVSMTNRLASTFILFLINLVKIGILLMLGVIQIFLQILTNVMILTVPVLLLLAIVPFFGGLNILKWLGERYLGIQINIILLSFAIGILIVIDKVILEFFTELGTSFTVALLIQCICWVLLIVFRKQIALNFSKIQRRINGSVVAGRLMNKVMDKEAEAGKWAGEKVGAAGEKVTRPVRNAAVDMKDLTVRKVKYAGKYAAGNAKLAAAKTTAGAIDKVATKLKDIKNRKDEVESSNVNTFNTRDNVNQVNKEDNIKSSKNNIKDKLNEARKADEESVITDINDKENNIKMNEKVIKDKLNKNQDKDKEIESVNMKDIDKEKLKKSLEEEKFIKDKIEEKPKVISFNEARVNKGKEEINEEELKSNLRKDLQKEYRTEKRVKSEETQKKIQETRAEKLKTRLGVSQSKIKEKEKELARELKKINNSKGKVKR